MVKKEDMLSHINQRISDMKAERDKFLPEWDMCDIQYEAEVYEDNFWKLYVNDNMEQNLTEMELGRTAWLPVFDVKPDWYKTDTQILETSRYILDYFLDKEMFYKEYRDWKMWKAKYGTAVFYTGIRLEIDKIPKFDWENDNITDAFFNNNKQSEETRTNWLFTPKNVPLRLFLFDDRQMYQSNFDLIEDCVMIEFITKESLLIRYDGIKWFDKKVMEEAMETSVEESAYWTKSWQNEMVVLYHYFNKLDKTYAININQDALLYLWKMPYPDGKLPFVVAQHYPRNNCIYGIGIPRKVRMSKAYKNNMMQYAMDGAKLSSGRLIATSSQAVDWDIFVAPWEISIAQFTNNVSDMRDINTQVDIQWPLNMIAQIDRDVRSQTGIDLQSVFEPPADQLGTVEIIEENKQIRNKSVDELRDQAIDEAYTKTLNNIAAFAPELMREKKTIKVEGKDAGEVTVAYPQIQIPNVKIKQKKNEVTIEKSMWTYGYLTFEPWVITTWLSVRIVTATTYNSTMAVIERNKNDNMIKKYIEMAQIPWMIELMQEELPLKQILEKRKRVEWLDDKQMVADTTVDKINKKNDEKFQNLKSLLSPTAQNDQPLQENQAPWATAPMQGGWMPTEGQPAQAPIWGTPNLQEALWNVQGNI